LDAGEVWSPCDHSYDWHDYICHQGINNFLKSPSFIFKYFNSIYFNNSCYL
jgi:hypothetical protein